MEITSQSQASLTVVADIPLPPGYKRASLDSQSFGQWLRSIPLKKDRQVYLYNGQLKRNQSAQFVVMDIPVGKKDLQQCADAVMRLRAEYFLKQEQLNKIVFKATDGTILSFADWREGVRYRLSGSRLISSRQNPGNNSLQSDFESFLETVFMYCGTYSLQSETRAINISDMQPGDVFVQGGSPGHAMIVMDMAINEAGHKIFMLAQSYMPAQDIHIVKNPHEEESTPWFEIDREQPIITPQWQFETSQLRRW
jgi:hypothetical protein